MVNTAVTCSYAVSDVATNVCEVCKELSNEATKKDGDQTARYVTTVRPAMATTRYVSAKGAARQRHGGGDARETGISDERGHQAGEVASDTEVATAGEGASPTNGKERADDKGEVVGNSIAQVLLA